MAGAEPLVISQLEAFIRLGEGIGITVIGGDLASKAERCYFSRDILMETLHEGPILLAGEKLPSTGSSIPYPSGRICRRTALEGMGSW